MGTYCNYKIKDDVSFYDIEKINQRLRKYKVEIITPNILYDWTDNLNKHPEFLPGIKRPARPAMLIKELPTHWATPRKGQFKISGQNLTEEMLRSIINIFIKHLDKFEYITETEDMFNYYDITEEQFNKIKHLDPNVHRL